MKNIKNWLTKNNFTFEVVKWHVENDMHVDAIMVNNNYEGMHPTKEVIDNLRKIEKYINRFQKSYKAEQVGHYTGILIQPKIDKTIVSQEQNEINDLSPTESEKEGLKTLASEQQQTTLNNTEIEVLTRINNNIKLQNERNEYIKKGKEIKEILVNTLSYNNYILLNDLLNKSYYQIQSDLNKNKILNTDVIEVIKQVNQIHNILNQGEILDILNISLEVAADPEQQEKENNNNKNMEVENMSKNKLIGIDNIITLDIFKTMLNARIDYSIEPVEYILNHINFVARVTTIQGRHALIIRNKKEYASNFTIDITDVNENSYIEAVQQTNRDIILNQIIEGEYINYNLNIHNPMIKKLIVDNDITIYNIKNLTLEYLKGDKGEYQIINVLFKNGYSTAIRIYKDDYMSFIEDIKEELYISESATTKDPDILENNIEVVEHNAKLIDNINNVINTIDNLLIIKNDTLVQQLKSNYKRLITDINKSFIKDTYIIEDINDNIRNNTRELNAIDAGFYYRDRLKSLKISDLNYTLENNTIDKLAKKYLNERYECSKEQFILLFENFVYVIDADKKELINNDSIFTFAYTNQTNLKNMNDLLAKNIIVKGFNYINKNDLNHATA